jgi:hypothetical protein
MSATLQAVKTQVRSDCGQDEVFASFAALKRERAKHAGMLANDVLDKWHEAKCKLAVTNRAFSLLFRPFDLIPIGETIHSRIIGELLDPHGSHGQGDLFLLSFLTLLGVPEPARGKWVVTVERWHVDVLLSRKEPASVIIIENKSNNAADQSNQLYRYWHQQIFKRYPDLDYSLPETRASFKVVYLPPDTSKKPDAESLLRPCQWDETKELRSYPRIPFEVVDTVSFRADIASWLTKVSSRLDGRNARLRLFLEFYAEIWR